jgi:nucleotide-binding universal stress UspA family protein
MENSEKSILVPWDFSQHSLYALQNAIEISKVTGYNINLLHVIRKAGEEAPAREKLEKLVTELESKYNYKPGFIIKTGTIFETIKEVANDNNEYAFAVMKTDGVKGMQRYTGSRAIKIICGSKIPFIVVQQPPKQESFAKLLYPIDYRIENKQILGYISYLKRFYNFKLVLMKPQTNDKIFKKNINNTVNFAKVYMDSKSISYEIYKPETKGDYASQIIECAHAKDCDMILIQLEKNLTLTKFLFGVKEQKILANPYKIPVMCLNPRIELTRYAGFH